MNRHAREADLGFSLIELLVTMVIAAIVFMAMVPLFVGAQQKNSADSFRQMALNLAQDRVEKVRALDYSSITEANLNDPSFANGAFGPTATIDSGGSTRTLDVHYTVPAPGTEDFKTVTVSVDWTAPPAVKKVIVQTVVYRQYAGPTIATFWTDPAMSEDGVIGDASLTTVTLNAIPTQPWLGSNTASVQFTVWDGGGTLVTTQTVKWGDNAATYGVDSDNTFWWDWDSTGTVDGTYAVTATASSGTYQGPTERFYIKLARGITSAVPSDLQIMPGASEREPDVDHGAEAPRRIRSIAERARQVRGRTVSSPTVATYTDTGLSPRRRPIGTRSRRSTRAATESATCAAVSTTTLAPTGDTTPPTVPTWASPAITADVAGPGVIELTWNASTDAGVGMQDYRIWRSTTASSGWTVIATWTNLLSLVYDDTVGSGQTRYYRSPPGTCH